MHEYDTAMKSVLKRMTAAGFSQLTGFVVSHWHNVELPEVRGPRVDMLCEAADGRLLHIELQSTNDPDMALRMAEYALAIYRQFRRRPEQMVLYAGEAPLRMSPRFWEFECRMVDIRDLDGKPLLESGGLEDNIISILMRSPDSRAAARRILQRIALAEPAERATALAELYILAGLRQMTAVIKEETSKMPLLNDLMDDAVFGPKLRSARREGLEEGRREGERQIVLRQIERRFGPAPDWAAHRLDAMTVAEIENVADRLLDAPSLEDLLN